MRFMATAAEQSRIVHDLLESVERDSQQSQRSRASEFGIAVGLVNAYLKYCIRKGYIRVRKVPMKRYVYFFDAKGICRKVAIEPDAYFQFFAFFSAGAVELLRCI